MQKGAEALFANLHGLARIPRHVPTDTLMSNF
jgi:hypothetical protein